MVEYGENKVMVNGEVNWSSSEGNELGDGGRRSSAFWRSSKQMWLSTVRKRG